MLQMRQEGYTPGMYVRAWHSQNRGQPRSLGKPWQVVRLQKTDELNLDDMPTMPISTGRHKTTERLLPLDKQGRPYLKKTNQERSLLDLCDEIIYEYHYISGEYPVELVLSAYRFLNLDATSARFGGFYTADAKMLIPYVLDPSIRFPDYCVMARGTAQDAWMR